jgi:hypothetical protein
MKTVLHPVGGSSFWIDAVRDLIIVVVGILLCYSSRPGGRTDRIAMKTVRSLPGFEKSSP